jgi:hypothetical protein
MSINIGLRHNLIKIVISNVSIRFESKPKIVLLNIKTNKSAYKLHTIVTHILIFTMNVIWKDIQILMALELYCIAGTRRFSTFISWFEKYKSMK